MTHQPFPTKPAGRMRPSPSATCPRYSTTSARRPRALAWCVQPPQIDLGAPSAFLSWVCARVFATPSPARVNSPARTRRNRAVRHRDPERRPSIHVPRDLPISPVLTRHRLPPCLNQGGVTKWGRTSQRTTQHRPRDISNATGGTMTTRTGEPATKRESYTAYIEGRAAKVI